MAILGACGGILAAGTMDGHAFSCRLRSFENVLTFKRAYDLVFDAGEMETHIFKLTEVTLASALAASAWLHYD